MYRCPNCGSPVEEGESSCDACGADRLAEQHAGRPHRESREIGRRALLTGGGVAIAAAVGGCLGGDDSGDGDDSSGDDGTSGDDSSGDDGTSGDDSSGDDGTSGDDSSGDDSSGDDGTSGDDSSGDDGTSGEDTDSPDAPGSSFQNAPVVSPGRHGSYEITGGESHYFAVDLEAGDELVATIEFSHGEGDLDLDLYGPAETIQDSSISFSDNETVTVTASEGGTYYISPYGFGQATNSYELVVERNPTGGDDGDPPDTGGDSPGGTFQSALPVSPGSYGPYQITDNKEHYFAVDLEAGEELMATIEFSHSEGDLDLDLYGPAQGLQSSSASTTDDETAVLTASEAGTHYINVYGFLGATNSYELDVEVSAGGGDDGTDDPPDGESPDSPGASFQTAPTVSPGRHGPYEITDGEDHYFAFELGENEELEVTIEFSHSEGDLDLDLYGPDQGLRATGTSTTDDETVTVTATEAGTYYINPYGFFTDTTNSYELVIELAMLPD